MDTMFYERNRERDFHKEKLVAASRINSAYSFITVVQLLTAANGIRLRFRGLFA